jgi:hypothetical protein
VAAEYAIVVYITRPSQFWPEFLVPVSHTHLEFNLATGKKVNRFEIVLIMLLDIVLIYCKSIHVSNIYYLDLLLDLPGDKAFAIMPNILG